MEKGYVMDNWSVCVCSCPPEEVCGACGGRGFPSRRLSCGSLSRGLSGRVCRRIIMRIRHRPDPNICKIM